jgi:SEC-C motif-containing protein
MPNCPCCSGLTLADCCGPIIDGALAGSAEALMRSRYSAYVLGKLDHVQRTNAPEIGDDFNRAEAERTAQEVQWLGLDVLAANETGDTGSVEFSIRFSRNGQELGQHELASFRRDDGRWLYVSGVVGSKPAPRQVTKIGRNEPCPCHSGKKYKKCCGA